MSSITLSFLQTFDKKFTKVLCGLYPLSKDTRNEPMKEGKGGIKARGEEGNAYDMQLEGGTVG